MSSLVVSCCVRGCLNMSSKRNTQGGRIQFYKFPTSVTNAAWITVKREKWINAVKNYVNNPNSFEPNKNTRICSAHFVNNRKSDNPAHPSYVPSLFPGKENKRRSIRALQKYARSVQRKTKLKDIKNTNESQALTAKDQNSVKAQNKEMNFTNSNPYNIASPSKLCQTEKILNNENISEEPTYFLCNINTFNGVSSAEVQVNIALPVSNATKSNNKVMSAHKSAQRVSSSKQQVKSPVKKTVKKNS